MERLTKRRKDGHAEPARFTQFIGEEMDDKLADYENTGLEPKDIEEMKHELAGLEWEIERSHEIELGDDL